MIFFMKIFKINKIIKCFTILLIIISLLIIFLHISGNTEIIIECIPECAEIEKDYSDSSNLEKVQDSNSISEDNNDVNVNKKTNYKKYLLIGLGCVIAGAILYFIIRKFNQDGGGGGDDIFYQNSGRTTIEEYVNYVRDRNLLTEQNDRLAEKALEEARAILLGANLLQEADCFRYYVSITFASIYLYNLLEIIEEIEEDGIPKGPNEIIATKAIEEANSILQDTINVITKKDDAMKLRYEDMVERGRRT